MTGGTDGLRRERLNEEVATAYLKKAGFELRRDRSWRPPAGRKHLTEQERRAILYLVRECEFDGLLTDAQHAERQRQLRADQAHAREAATPLSSTGEQPISRRRVAVFRRLSARRG